MEMNSKMGQDLLLPPQKKAHLPKSQPIEYVNQML